MSKKAKQKKQTSSKRPIRHSDQRPNLNFSGKETRKENPNLYYGLHAVREIILNPKRRIEAVFTVHTDVFNDDLMVKKALQKLPVYQISKQELDQKLSFDSVHQGIAVQTSRLPDYSLEEILHRLENKKKSCFVMLDQVTDPHNIGAILRSTCVFGADGLIVQDKNAPDLNPTIAKIACGAMEHIPYIQEVNLSRALETLQKKGYWCIGLDERGEQTIKQATENLDKVVLVMGAEGPGLRPLVAKTCDQLAKLPTFGHIQSLNVSNATAVALYEVVRSK